MTRVVFITAFLASSLFGTQSSFAKIAKLSNKGEKVVKTLCDAKKLPNATGTVEQLMQNIKDSKACPSLSKSNLEAVAYYLSNGSMKQTGKNLTVPQNAKCPVCGMYVAKYPKWAASMNVGEKTYYFDGVKDMMKYYIFDGDFIYDRDKIGGMFVTDFYTLESILAKEAFYVIGSDIFGPMGNELIPFKSHKEAKSFLDEHKGGEIILFDQITAKMVMALDGFEYE